MTQNRITPENPLGVLGEAILNSSPAGILVTDKEGNVVYANPVFGYIYKCDPKTLIGTNILASDPSGALAEAFRLKQPVYAKKYTPPGAPCEILSHAFCLYLHGEFAGGVLFVQEATEALEVFTQLVRAQEAVTVLSQKVERMGQVAHTFESIIGQSEPLRRVLKVARRAAMVNSAVLLRGETGTGKELFAAAIHNASARAKGPFIHVNCAAIPDALLESEFFGHEKGAFTGAVRRKLGMFELADGGTIFLDEIGDLDLRLQAKLLQVLQSGEFRRVGGTTPIKADVRVIAATNRNLEELIHKGLFRRDLYFRLNVIEIVLPPLRERKDDIPLLTEYLLEKIGRRIGKRFSGITKDALSKLEKYCWPGNIRELENVLERALILAPEGSQIGPEDIHIPSTSTAAGNEDRIISLNEWEKTMIPKALSRYGATVEGKKKAADALGISLSTLYRKLKEFGLEE